MQSAPSGSAPFTLSVLAGGGTGIGTTAEQGLASTISLARTADRRGFRRFWMSEHHAMPARSVASPPLMIARLIAETSRIRLGAGGIMLSEPRPLGRRRAVRNAHALAPHRIDLGLGRALARTMRPPGVAPRSQRQRWVPSTGHRVARLPDRRVPAGHPYRDVHAVPGPWQAAQNRIRTEEFGPEIWILGSSPFSAQLAAQLGRPYAFALQFGNADIDTALHIHREQFQPSEVLAEPHALVSVPVAISDDSVEAERQASSSAMAMLRMFKREPFQFLPPDEVEAYPATAQEKQVLDAHTHHTLHGKPATVADHLEALHDQTGVDEVMLVGGGHSAAFEERGVELIADHYGLPHN